MEKNYGTGIKIVGILILASILLCVGSLIFAYYRDDVSKPASKRTKRPGSENQLSDSNILIKIFQINWKTGAVCLQF